MDLLEDRITLAAQNKEELNRLITDYLPFIKKQLSGFQGDLLEYDDMLSVAMITFAGSVSMYQQERGSFLAFAARNIKNRLIDELRKQKKYRYNRIEDDTAEDGNQSSEVIASLYQYDKEQEHNSLCMEIELYAQSLSTYGIQFSDLPKISPKHKTSRIFCIKIARTIVHDQKMRRHLQESRQLMKQELAAMFHVSAKTIEKHRRYIVALVVLLLEDYIYLQTFLPGRQEEEG